MKLEFELKQFDKKEREYTGSSVGISYGGSVNEKQTKCCKKCQNVGVLK